MQGGGLPKREGQDARTLAGGARPNRGALDPAALHIAGARLVTSDGFGCTSCHQVGRTMPEKDEIRSRGPDLALLGRRVRRESIRLASSL